MHECHKTQKIAGVSDLCNSSLSISGPWIFVLYFGQQKTLWTNDRFAEPLLSKHQTQLQYLHFGPPSLQSSSYVLYLVLQRLAELAMSHVHSLHILHLTNEGP